MTRYYSYGESHKGLLCILKTSYCHLPKFGKASITVNVIRGVLILLLITGAQWQIDGGRTIKWLWNFFQPLSMFILLLLVSFQQSWSLDSKYCQCMNNSLTHFSPLEISDSGWGGGGEERFECVHHQKSSRLILGSWKSCCFEDVCSYPSFFFLFSGSSERLPSLGVWGHEGIRKQPLGDLRKHGAARWRASLEHDGSAVPNKGPEAPKLRLRWKARA